MIQLELGIRYLSQLRRTRPNDIGRLESIVTGVLGDSGAKLRRESGFLFASFNESAISFGIDLAIAIEGVVNALALVEKELLGRSCVVRVKTDTDSDSVTLCRRLSAKENRSGVWCDAHVSSVLAEYATFRQSGDFFALENFTFRNRSACSYRDFRIRPAIVEALYSFHLSDASIPRSTVALEGAPYMGKRQSLLAVLEHISSCVKVLRISFNEKGQCLSSIADVVTEERLLEIDIDDSATGSKLRALLGTVRAVKAARISMEIASSLRDAFSVFFATFAPAWSSSAEKARIPVFVIENAHLADAFSRSLLRSVLGELASEGRVHLILTGTGDDAFRDICVGRFRILRIEAPNKEEWTPLIASARAAYHLPQVDDEFVSRCVSDAALNGVPSGYRLTIGWEQTEDGRPKSIHPHLSGDLLEIAYAVSLWCDIFPTEDLAEAFASEHKPHEALPLMLAHLAELGVIDDEYDPRPSIPQFAEFAEKYLGLRSEAIRNLVRNRLLNAMETKRLSKSYEATLHLSRLGGKPDSNSILDAVVDGVLRGEFLAVESALSDGTFPEIVGKDFSESLAEIFRSRKALVFGDEALAREVFSKPILDTFPNPRYHAYALSDRASFAFSADSLDAASSAQAANSAKSALILLQNNPSEKGLSRAYRLLGETALSRERISEAVDYFGFAAESAERSDEPYEALLSSVNGACTQFLLGNISKSQRHAIDAERRAGELYQTDWLLWARFMQARIQFEIGLYERAAQSFSSLSSKNESINLFRNWRDRAFAYSDSPIGTFFVDTTDDTTFFRIESAFLRGDYEDAIREADEYLSAPNSVRFRNPERVDWSSGFALIEDRAIGRTGYERISKRLVRVYRAFALAKSERAHESVAELRRIVKDEPISDLDPYDAFYYWTLSVALKASDAPEVDTGTILSIAFKRLQRRASRIDDPESKRSYLMSNRWNRALYADAKSINLI